MFYMIHLDITNEQLIYTVHDLKEKQIEGKFLGDF